ncbi:uncharacterized protein METZ01_LOCUS352559 [marine metagenome]|uniref:Sulfatase-modifying factor enzyme-like domain-containing protein n=1 Tax=marine metagenome TaxID=408172 RepID=A0A382RRC4_9ZZZZ
MIQLLIIFSILLLSYPLFGQSDKSEGSWTEPITGIKFLYIPGGTFVMGSPTTEEGRQQFAETQHPVTVGNFWLAETEVTQAQWKAVMGGNPSDFKGDDRPVEKVNWYDVQEFIKKLNSRTGKQFRLPTEAEWDYRQTAPVKSFAPNGFGLYDMLGNVWEWTCSAYEWSYGGSENRCVNQAEHVSIRGGSWFHKPRWMRAAHRRFTLPHFRPFFYGFRLARD